METEENIIKAPNRFNEFKKSFQDDTKLNADENLSLYLQYITFRSIDQLLMYNLIRDNVGKNDYTVDI